MQAPDSVLSHLAELGLDGHRTVYYNLNPAECYEQSLQREESTLAANGPLVTVTAPCTGRSPNDRFLVKEPTTEDSVGWGDTNKPVTEALFERLLAKFAPHVQGKDLFVRDCFAGADERYRLPVRIVTEKAWHSLFAYNMFRRPEAGELDGFEPGFTVVDCCELRADDEAGEDGELHSGTFVVVNLKEKLVLIGGTHYGGEIKKSIFSVLNYMLPAQGVFPMHCSANETTAGDQTAVFFGLSGTGKTTLSADASRTLIGDDEHGWSEEGVFNFEGGCYAKAINLTQEGEPEIYATTKEFGTIAENVILRDDRSIDFEDTSITQNTRLSYPLTSIPNASESGKGGTPETIIMLTADAFGVLPPISKLTPEQAMYHFLSGYTAKVAGTEKGVTEPKATFSACFGEPFMVRPPAEYAEMLGDRIRKSGARCFLVNTGWTGGPYGEGKRMKLPYTRAMVEAALAGELDDVETTTDSIFGLHIPTEVPNVPTEVLVPRDTWADGDAYDEKARKLAQMFATNFEKYDASEAIKSAGPTMQAA